MEIEVCPKCGGKMYSGSKNQLSHHHIKPKHVFGLQGVSVAICRKCHDDLEKLIQAFERSILEDYEAEYEELYYQFIEDDNEISDL